MSRYTELEDVLEGYAIETPEGNDPAILKKWMSDYPEYAEDLLAFAGDRSRIRNLPDPVLLESEIKASMVRSREALKAVRGSYAGETTSIGSLTERAEERGLNKESFAKAVGLSLSLIMYFEKRRLVAASIPDRLIKKTAEVLRSTKEAVEEYLHRPPVAGAASYKAESRPEDAPLKDFADAVKEDRDLTEDEKRSLLE